MNRVASGLARSVAAHGRAVLVTVAQGQGSVPREPGASMIVDRAEVHGTIGGGHLVFEASRLAREALDGGTPPSTWIVRFPLAARLGQCCGGVATLAFGVVDAADGWLDAAVACERTGTACAIVQRIDATAGRMLVTHDDTRGSLGSTALDSHAVLIARARVAAGASTSLVEAEGATLLVQVVDADRFDVVVFGNGHVGRALAAVLSAAGADLRWVDERENDFPTSVPPNVEVVASDDPVGEVAHAPRGAHLVITTHSHALDYALVDAALDRDDWSYLGLIGSRSKRAQFEKRLAARGRTPADLARITCPIGAKAGLAGKAPGTIAVAVAAELLALREARSASGHATTPSIRDLPRRGRR
jgi:xanthine dehydrogenase accessory factor